jgi:DNA-binding transcriptional LysR family regulator
MFVFEKYYCNDSDSIGGELMASNAERTLNILDILQSIKVYGSITAVAKHLYVSQPYISRKIIQTENQMQVKLIDRSVKPLRLTHAGDVMVEGMINLMNEYNRLQEHVTTVSRDKVGTLSVNFTETSSPTFIARVISEYQQQYPQYRLNVIENISSVGFRDVIDGKADAYFGIEPVHHGQANMDYVAEQKIRVVVPKTIDIPDVVTEAEQLRALDGLDVVEYRDVSVMDDRILEVFKSVGIRQFARTSLININTVYKVAMVSHLCAILPESLEPYAETEDMKVVTIEPNVFSFPLVCTCRDGINNRAEYVAFKRVIRGMYQE